MLKGFKCNICGHKFQAKNALDLKTQGLQSMCTCPNCQQLVKSNLSIINTILFVIFGAIFFVLLFNSILHWSNEVTGLITFAGPLVALYFVRKIIPAGYIQMHKVSH